MKNQQPQLCRMVIISMITYFISSLLKNCRTKKYFDGIPKKNVDPSEQQSKPKLPVYFKVLIPNLTCAYLNRKICSNLIENKQ